MKYPKYLKQGDNAVFKICESGIVIEVSESPIISEVVMTAYDVDTIKNKLEEQYTEGRGVVEISEDTFCLKLLQINKKILELI